DWSSDVCSSDLGRNTAQGDPARTIRAPYQIPHAAAWHCARRRSRRLSVARTAQAEPMNEDAMNNPPVVPPVLADATDAAKASTAEAAAPAYGRETKPVPADALIIVPSRNVVLFPGVVFPLTIGRPGSIAAAQEALRAERPIGVLLQRQP